MAAVERQTKWLTPKENQNGCRRKTTKPDARHEQMEND
jgi:hypothetical protein